MVMRLLEDRKCQFAEGKERDKRTMYSIKKNPHTLKIKNTRDCQPKVIRLDR